MTQGKILSFFESVVHAAGMLFTDDDPIPAIIDEDPDLEFLRRLVVLLSEGRTSKGISLRQLSMEIRYSYSYLSKVERGETQPGVVTLRRWARAVGLDFSQAVKAANDAG